VAVAVLVLTQLMLVVDTSIVNVALPDIGRELGFSSATLSWVVTAYALSFGGLFLVQQLGSAMGLAILASVLAGTGGLDHGLSTTFLTAAAFPLTALILFGVWARRIPDPAAK
jgi:MFS family permease